MYAVIETGGKQYRVSEGDVVFVEKLEAEADSTVTFDRVLAVGKDEGVVIGAPLVEGARVTGKVLKQGKGKKITVFTYRSKKNSKRKLGHRQRYTKVEIESVTA
ncbi:MAG: 50S ribosomal protein L21 [Oscillospiraceae bacterium]|jgi:large subunit ribosomal protein L21|nr:50S ribosomal protein L21 [Oscillospiraceae bacterium]